MPSATMTFLVSMPRFDPNKIAVFRTTAQVVDMELTEDNLRQAINVAVARVRTGGQADAAASPVGPNDKPRILQITAWVCHAGKPNRNQFAFLKEDLEEAVANGLFQAPFFGMIDFNHDFQAYGAWYDAKFAFDEKAQEWGILAHGAIWAWRFEELANLLLAEQQRHGEIAVSITALYKEAELKERPDGSGRYLLIRKPVIVTTSVLDEEPADPNARGLGSEDPDQSGADREAELMRTKLASLTAADDEHSEESNMKEIIEKIEAALGEQKDALKETLQPLVDAATRLPAVEQELRDAKAALETATGEKDALTASVESLTTEKKTLETALNAAKESLDAANAELEALRAFKAEVEQKEAKAARDARDAARLAEIPEAVKAELDKREDKDALLKSWMEQDDAAWESTKAVFAVATASTGKRSRSDRSAEEGVLSSAADTNRGEWAIDRLPARK